MQFTPNNPGRSKAQPKVLPSWWQRTFGDSLLKAVTGNFFTDRNNAASLIALMLVYSICTIVVRDQKYEYVDGLLNIVFVVIGYYFGAKRDIEPQGDEKL